MVEIREGKIGENGVKKEDRWYRNVDDLDNVYSFGDSIKTSGDPIKGFKFTYGEITLFKVDKNLFSEKERNIMKWFRI